MGTSSGGPRRRGRIPGHPHARFSARRVHGKSCSFHLCAMFDRVSEAMRKGFTTEDMQQAKLLDGLPRTWADPDKALYDAHKSMWAHYNKLSHSIV
jgi:hypothetical protein